MVEAAALTAVLNFDSCVSRLATDAKHTNYSTASSSKKKKDITEHFEELSMTRSLLMSGL